MQQLKNKVILSLAGFDPSGGAGILEDFNTISTFGINALCIPTVLTVQDHLNLYSSTNIEHSYFIDAFEVLLKTYKIEAIKIGLINDESLLSKISQILEDEKIPNILVDPIINSSSGYSVWNEAIFNLMTNKMFYQIDFITPNLEEFNLIYKYVFNEDYLNLKDAIIKIQRKYLFKIAVTGVEETKTEIKNIYYDGAIFKEHIIKDKVIYEGNIHGTGCKFSSSLLSNFFLNGDFIKSCVLASDYVKSKI